MFWEVVCVLAGSVCLGGFACLGSFCVFLWFCVFWERTRKRERNAMLIRALHIN